MEDFNPSIHAPNQRSYPSSLLPPLFLTSPTRFIIFCSVSSVATEVFFSPMVYKMFISRPCVISLLLVLLSYGQPLYGESIDERLYKTLHDAYRSPWMDTLMGQATDLGGTKAHLFLCTVLATYGSTYDRETAKLTFTSLAGTAAVVAGLKWTVNRSRPEGITNRRNSSFPSAHAAAAFATATLFSHRYPRYRLIYYTIASVISFSRIYLGRHYPSDVIVGGAIGHFGSRGAIHFRRNILALQLRFQ